MSGMQAVHDGTKRDLSQVRDLRRDQWVFITVKVKAQMFFW